MLTDTKEEMEKAHLEPHVSYIEMHRHQIINYFKGLMTNHTLPTIVITSDMMLNQLVLSALYTLNIRIPDNIQTATFNDSFISATASPPQTAVNIQPQRLGQAAGESIIKLLKEEPIEDRNKIISTHIVKRASTQGI